MNRRTLLRSVPVLVAAAGAGTLFPSQSSLSFSERERLRELVRQQLIVAKVRQTEFAAKYLASVVNGDVIPDRDTVRWAEQTLDVVLCAYYDSHASERDGSLVVVPA